MADPAPLLPEVSGEDIDWVCGVMNLRAFDQPRREFLQARTTLDVSACPGSGKTTLIVAKLAIMARKWPHRTRGICVLSHTNAAREEIQHRLRGTVVGQQLLGYPHFIDTIHGFVNRFLALPWLNSNGYPSPTIDDGVTTAYRRGVLTNSEYWKIENFLGRKYTAFSKIQVRDRELRFGIEGKPFPAGPNAETFKLTKRAVETAAGAGYFCYDEMFIWANALLSDCPDVAAWLRRRFPLVIVDEMQDTSALQAGVLHAVFTRTSVDTVVQRVGDPNQAIFDGPRANSTDPDPFPDERGCLDIPNSFRFGPSIAALASPFAVTKVGTDGLCGVGPGEVGDAPVQCDHAVFIFPEDRTAGVLDAYGRHVLSIFSDDALAKRAVTAVGAVHQDAPGIDTADAHFPKTVPHYWSGYTAEIGRREPHPKSLVQYVRVAQAAVRDSRDLSPGVEKIAAGLVRLARRIGDGGQLRRRAATHRAVVEGLRAAPEATAAYRRLIRAFLIDWAPLDAETWNRRQADIISVARGLCETIRSPADANGFLTWDEDDASLKNSASTSPNDAGPNVYRVVDGERSVDIRLGSIHSVKGQTHLATMLLNTHWHDHSSKKMLPWLLGDKANANGAGSRDRDRLLQTYVAMTRPSHLVCLAIPRHAFGTGNAIDGYVKTLQSRGWRVADIIEGGAKWRT